MSQQDVFEIIDQIIKDNKIVLFMKGSKKIPMCGFSSVIVAILKKLDADFKDISDLVSPNEAVQ